MRLASLSLALAAAALGGCHPPLYVTSSRATAAPSRPKPADCALDFYRTKPPDRPYDEIATLHYAVQYGALPPQVQAAIQAKACELGADAVVVTRETYMGEAQGGTEVTATAVVYRPSP